ncbi:50S ribosomal protein L19, partial [Klebsiella pneumoniae]
NSPENSDGNDLSGTNQSNRNTRKKSRKRSEVKKTEKSSSLLVFSLPLPSAKIKVMNAAVQFVHDQLTVKKEYPKFKAGDNITVNYKIIEGGKERI